MHKNQTNGFTLIELMIAVAIVGIVMMVGIPSFGDTIKRNSIASVVNDIHTTLTEARSEAVTLGLTVSICSSNDQTTCSGSWTDGWILFSDANENGTVDGSDTLISVTGAAIGGNELRLAATNTSIMQYLNTGYSNQIGTFIGCPGDGDVEYSRALIVLSSGMVIKSRDTNGNNIDEDSLGVDLTCP